MIAEITLSNFRGFGNHTIPLRHLTIIVGKNNAGKSTIVEALRLITAITRRFQGLNYYELPPWIDRPRRERGVFPSTEDLSLSSIRTTTPRTAFRSALRPLEPKEFNFTSGNQGN